MDNVLSIERIKYLSKLSIKKYRQEFRQVIVEGINTIDQLITNGILPHEIYSTGSSDLHEGIANIARYVVTSKDMKRICDVDTPQAMAALYDIPNDRQHDFRRALYLDRISDPGNLGSIFRSASALGVDLIVLAPGSCEPYSPKVIRSSLGSVFWVPHFEADTAWLRGIVAHKISADMTGGIPLKEYRYDESKACMIVIGAEASGISHEIRACCDGVVSIEMTSKMESINASVAAGILCWQLFGSCR